MKILMKQVSEEPDAPSKFTDGISPALERVVLDCLAKNRDERPSSTDRLDEILATVEGAPDWTEDLARRWWEEHRPAKRHKDVEGHAKSKGSRGNGDVRGSP